MVVVGVVGSRPALAQRGCHAVAEHCRMPTGSVVRYWHSAKPANKDDDRCSPGSCSLSGWLFAPSDKPMQPAAVYVLGSGRKKNVAESCQIVSYFVSNGYVVLMPFMRGVEDTSPHCPSVLPGAGFENSGTYIKDDDDSNLLVSMEEQVTDLNAALHTLAALPSRKPGLPLVDRTKIALLGHSFGGAEVLIAAAKVLDPEPAVTVDMSGGVLSWKASWEKFLLPKAHDHRMPLFIFQAANESPNGGGYIESTVAPFREANGHGRGGVRMTVYSDVQVPDQFRADNCANLPANQCAHIFFVQDADEVKRWMPDVHHFMSAHGVR